MLSSRSYLLLFAQLLVFFFVSSLTITSSNAYADINRTWTDTELKNVIYRYYVHYRGINETTVINWIDSHQSNIDTLLNKINSSNLVTICNNDGYGLVFLFPASSNPGYYLYNNKLQISNRVTGDIGYYFGRSSLGFNSRTNLSDFSSYRIYYDYLYTSAYISQNYPAGYYTPSTFFDEWFYEDTPLFGFIPKPSDTTVDVWSFEDIPLYKFSGDEDFYFGQLYVPFTANTYETNSNFFYRWGDWQFRTLPDSATYLEYVGSDEQAALYDVYLDKNYLFDNTIYSLVWTDTTTDPYTLAAANFYLGDKNTIIVDGTVDPSKTFSGDYDDKYNYQNDPNQNFWKDTYNRFMTPSGDVLRGTITTLMSELDFTTSGEESGELMMALVGLDVISNDFGDFIISWNDFDPHLSIKGNSITPMADGNILKNTGHFIPAGQINFSALEREHETFHDIMQYTRAILSFSVICLFFSNLWHTLLITLGISTQIYEKDQINKEKLLKQAERDQRKLEREDRQRYQQWLYEHRR